MKKDKEWLKEAVGELNLVDTVFKAGGVSHIDTAVSVMQVYDLIDQLEDSEKLEDSDKVVIPKFVADWWERDGYSVTMYGGLRIEKKHKLDLITKFYEKGLDGYLSKVEDWIHRNHSSFLDLVNEKPYDIEKEKLYRVEMHGTTDVALLTLEGNEYYFDEPLDYVGERPNIRQEFTESEIKTFDERYWQFAVEVAE